MKNFEASQKSSGRYRHEAMIEIISKIAVWMEVNGWKTTTNITVPRMMGNGTYKSVA